MTESETRQADALVVTPEMVQAGIDELVNYRLGDDLGELARDVFMMMASTWLRHRQPFLQDMPQQVEQSQEGSSQQ